MKLGKYMEVEKIGDEWDIYNSRQGGALGSVVWHEAWRQYVFVPEGASDLIFNNTCLLDIAAFLKQQNELKKGG